VKGANRPHHPGNIPPPPPPPPERQKPVKRYTVGTGPQSRTDINFIRRPLPKRLAGLFPSCCAAVTRSTGSIFSGKGGGHRDPCVPLSFAASS